MYRIDNATAVPQLPIAGPPLNPGYFTDGNPAAGLEATILDGWWLNMVQEEILNVVTAVGLVPSKTNRTQLLEAIQAIAVGANPDLSGFLPITGGTLYRPGGSDILAMNVDQGQSARMLFNVAATHMWGVGTSSTGLFEIGDWDRGVPVLIIDADAMVTMVGALWVGGPFSAPSGNIPGDFVIGGDLHMPSGGNIYAGSGGTLFATRGEIGGLLTAAGNIVTGGSLTSQGATISGLTHTDQILTNNEATIGTTLTVNSTATVGGALRTNGNRFLTYGGNNPCVAMVNSGAAPGFGLWVGGNPGRLTIGTVDTSGNPLAILLTMDGEGYTTLPALVVSGGAVIGGALQNNGLATLAAGLSTTNATMTGTLTLPIISGTSGDGATLQVANHLGVGGRADFILDANFYANVYLSNSLFMTAPTAELRLTSALAFKLGGGPWEDQSDRRLKTAIAPYQHGLAEILRLQPVSYQNNGRGGRPVDGKTYISLIADDVEAIMPEMVGSMPLQLDPEDSDDFTDVKTLNTNALQYAVVNAIKELAVRLEVLERRTT